MTTRHHLLFALIDVTSAPAVFCFYLSVEGSVEYRTMHHTPGNVICMIGLPAVGALLYSIDNTHLPYSTTVMLDAPPTQSPSFVGFIWSYLPVGPSQDRADQIGCLRSALNVCALEQTLPGDQNVGKGRSLRELLYGLESLRKRGNEESNEV